MDYESGKYVTDKLPTLNSYSLAEIVDDNIHNDMTYWYARHYGKYSYSIHEEKYKFIPKDNNFDEECKIDEEEANRKYHESLLIHQQIESAKLKEQYKLNEEKRIREQQEASLETIRVRKELKLREEIEYQERVKKREAELQAELRIAGYFGVKCDNIRNMPSMCNIRPNSWKPK